MEYQTLLMGLGFFAFCGGLIDAAVGGGGLVQLPALMHALPKHSLATVFGTNKMIAMAGTLSSALAYFKKVTINWKLILPTMVAAFIFSFFGAISVSLIPKELMRYIVFFLLIAIAIYTFAKKDLGQVHTVLQAGKREIALGILFGACIGFYDGIFGPGTGSFLLFLFVKVFAFDFLNASASAKLVNVATNAAAMFFFIPTGHVIWLAAVVLAVCNILGAITGTALAMKYGSGFIRIFFLILLVFLIGRMGYDLFSLSLF
ncbi:MULTISPECIES: TSUP family transporter [Acinetobacter]|uniref:Probable membrane transporter protein n=1 Tax=Acinetobacter piscicola TaxID=2006115 RepID=A0A7S6VVB6_9GAMM|nr:MULTISPECIES: TSUP family transporter [Acinetobacter]QOW45578.1 TSUP family transporter [Acinetobacter piscicola]